jgi:integrase
MFTDAALKRLQPRALPYRSFESGEIPGFCVQVTPTGSKTFYLQHTRAGNRRFYRLGQYPHLSLAAARAMAREHLVILETGGDPQAPKRRGLGTVADLIDAWLAYQQEKGGRRLDDVERAVRGNCAPILAMPAADVTATDIRDVLAAIHQRGSRVMANRVRAHLHALWTYGLRHDHDPRYLHRAVRFGLELNPVTAVPRDSAAERAGERVLSWVEVREVWETDRVSVPVRQALRLLLWSGARVNEVAQAPWAEFDLDSGLWTLPAERSKVHRATLTPLTPLALDLLAELREVFPGSPWLLPWRNVPWAKQPYGPTALGHAVKNAGFTWTPRDLRRTWKTLAGAAGLSLDIRNRVQGHALQDVGSRHYDRHSYAEEKRTALLAWERELQARLAGDNVVPIRRAG